MFMRSLDWLLRMESLMAALSYWRSRRQIPKASIDGMSWWSMGTCLQRKLTPKQTKLPNKATTLSQACWFCLMPGNTNPSKMGTQKRNEVSGFLVASWFVSSSGPPRACNCCTNAGCKTSALWLRSLNLAKMGDVIGWGENARALDIQKRHFPSLFLLCFRISGHGFKGEYKKCAAAKKRYATVDTWVGSEASSMPWSWPKDSAS